jgi:hypothetical protein
MAFGLRGWINKNWSGQSLPPQIDNNRASPTQWMSDESAVVDEHGQAIVLSVLSPIRSSKHSWHHI